MRRAFGTIAALLLVGCGDADSRGADNEPLGLKSRAVGRTVPATVVRPAGYNPADGFVVFLHGRDSTGDAQRTDAFYAALAATPGAPAVVFPTSDKASYWHARGRRDWAAYVADELIPAAARRLGADPRRVVVAGISMGGYGALHAAARAPGRLCAAAGHSPALWLSGGETPAEAFDDLEDFAASDPIGAAKRIPSPFAGQRIWLDVGADDPFRTATSVATRAIGDRPRTRVTARVWPGGHDQDYWDRHWPDYLRFYRSALRACR